MLGTFITFDTGFGTSTLTYMGYIISDFSTPISLFVGVLLGVLAIGWLVYMLKPNR